MEKLLTIFSIITLYCVIVSGQYFEFGEDELIGRDMQINFQREMFKRHANVYGGTKLGSGYGHNQVYGPENKHDRKTENPWVKNSNEKEEPHKSGGKPPQKHELSHHEGKHHEGKHHEGKHHEGKHHEGKHHEGKHHEGKNHEGKHHEGKHIEGKHHEGKHHEGKHHEHHEPNHHNQHHEHQSHHGHPHHDKEYPGHNNQEYYHKQPWESYGYGQPHKNMY